MPELPDVEILRQYAATTSLHQKIKKVEVRDRRILVGISASKLSRELVGQSFESTSRHGKYCFLHTNKGNSLALHFGMSGSLQYFKDLDQDPYYDRVLIGFTNGFHLAYCSQRLLGEVGLVESVPRFIKNRPLGPDALSVDYQTFKNVLRRKKGAIKAALLDQKVIAGIGNIYADETLFQCRLHPQTKLNELKEDEIKRLYQKTRWVLQTAVDKRADASRFPKSSLLPHRMRGERCPRCKSIFGQITVGGRTSYFCPRCQKR